MYYNNFFRAAIVELGQRISRRKETEIILLLLDGMKGKVLEIGSNLGYLAGLICKKNYVSVVGVDTNTSDAVLRFARWRNWMYNTSFFKRSGTNLQFPSDSFDCVILSHVIEHFQHPAVILNEAKRVLKDSGKMIVAVPKEKYLGELTTDHKTQFSSLEDLAKVLAESGMKVTVLVDLLKMMVVECEKD